MPPRATSDPGSQAVMDAIRRIVHALEVGSRAAQKSVGLSGAQMFILQTLAAGAPMSVNELAAASHTHQSSVSVVVSRLVDAKLVKRAPAAADSRRLELTVTPAGCRRLKANFVMPQQLLFDSLRRLPARRLAALRSVLEELIANSGFDEGTPPMFFEHTSARTGKNRVPATERRAKARE
jgi:DNA-binding MarR family transcriptional regulator